MIYVTLYEVIQVDQYQETANKIDWYSTATQTPPRIFYLLKVETKLIYRRFAPQPEHARKRDW